MILPRDSVGEMMRRFVEEADRGQWTLLPECLDDFIDESNPVRVIDVFVDALDLAAMSFEGVEPAATGRPSYHPSVLLKLYIYGYLNRVQSSRRLEREAGRNVEVMWLAGRLVPDHKTIADFRKDSWPGIKKRMYETGGQNAVRPDTLILGPHPSTKPGQVQLLRGGDDERPVFSLCRHHRTGAAGRVGGPALSHAPSTGRYRPATDRAARRSLRRRAINHHGIRTGVALSGAGSRAQGRRIL